MTVFWLSSKSKTTFNVSNINESRLRGEVNTANDMLRQIKQDGDSKADFYLPPAMEKVANVLAGHLTKSNVVHIKAELAATNLR